MKCEIKYIGHKCKRDYETLTIKEVSVILLVTGIFSFSITYLLTFNVAMTLYVITVILGLYFMWKDAVSYCENKTMEDK